MLRLKEDTFNSLIFSFSFFIWDSCDFEMLCWWLHIIATYYKLKNIIRVNINQTVQSIYAILLRINEYNKGQHLPNSPKYKHRGNSENKRLKKYRMCTKKFKKC